MCNTYSARTRYGTYPMASSSVLLCGCILSQVLWTEPSLRSPSPPPPPFSTILLCVSQCKSLTSVGQKEASFHSLAILECTVHVIRTNPYFRPILFNMDRTAGQAELIAQCFFKKSTIYCSAQPQLRKETPKKNIAHFVAGNLSCTVFYSVMHSWDSSTVHGELDFVFYSLTVLSQVSKSYTVLKTRIFITN